MTTASSCHPAHGSQPEGPNSIQRVLIVGGTHGNELTGVYAIKTFERYPDLVFRPSFETRTVIGNPWAAQQVTRYVDKDLNRCFDQQSWGTGASIQEETRAKTLLEQYGPDSKQPTDLVIDLHSTTSNAGLMLILDHLDPFTLKLAAYLQAQEPTVKLYSAAGSGRETDSLRTLGNYRLGIEVGPIAHGTLHAGLFQHTQTLIAHVLDYVEQYNQRDRSATQHPVTQSPARSLISVSPSTELTVYQYRGAIDYPKNEHGDIIAMVHPQRQFQDYAAVQPGDPMFLTFSGDTIVYQGETTVHPIFINEAAYYEKGIAMSLTEKKQVPLDYP